MVWLPARLRVSLTWRASPSVRHFPSANASGCCGPCTEDEECVGYTFNSADGGNCWLKKAVGKCSPGGTCTSAVVAGRHSAPVPPPPPYPGPLTCGYTGKVPPEPLRTKPSECHDMTCCSSCFRSRLSDAAVAWQCCSISRQTQESTLTWRRASPTPSRRSWRGSR